MLPQVTFPHRAMASLSLAEAPKPKRKAKTPHRRASVDAVPTGVGGLARPPGRMPRRMSTGALTKSVSFAQKSEVCVVEPSAPKRWYTGEDHRRFKLERLSDVVRFREDAVQRMRHPQASPPSPAADTSNCPVGIEQLLSRQQLREAQSGRQIVIRSVLLEQTRQRSHGVKDPEQIAFLSGTLSQDAFEGAQQRGKFQEMAKFV